MKESILLKMWSFVYPDVEPTVINNYGEPLIIGYDKYDDEDNLAWQLTESELTIEYIGKRDFGIE